MGSRGDKPPHASQNGSLLNTGPQNVRQRSRSPQTPPNDIGEHNILRFSNVVVVTTNGNYKLDKMSFVIEKGGRIRFKDKSRTRVFHKVVKVATKTVKDKVFLQLNFSKGTQAFKYEDIIAVYGRPAEFDSEDTLIGALKPFFPPNMTFATIDPNAIAKIMPQVLFTEKKKFTSKDPDYSSPLPMSASNKKQEAVVRHPSRTSVPKVIYDSQTDEQFEDLINDSDLYDDLAENIPKDNQICFYPKLQSNYDGHHVNLSNKDFKCLYNGNWINDILVEFFLHYYVDHYERSFQRKITQPAKIKVMSSFFYTTLSKSPSSYLNVKSWFKNINLLLYDYVIIPIIVESHWFLVIFTGMPSLVDGKDPNDSESSSEINPSLIPTVHFLDSLKSRHLRQFKILKSFIIEHINDKFENPPSLKQMEKRIIYHEAIVPKQNNFNDCGIHVIQNVKSFLENMETFKRDILFNSRSFSAENLLIKSKSNKLTTSLNFPSKEYGRGKRSLLVEEIPAPVNTAENNHNNNKAISKRNMRLLSPGHTPDDSTSTVTVRKSSRYLGQTDQNILSDNDINDPDFIDANTELDMNISKSHRHLEKMNDAKKVNARENLRNVLIELLHDQVKKSGSKDQLEQIGLTYHQLEILGIEFDPNTDLPMNNDSNSEGDNQNDSNNVDNINEEDDDDFFIHSEKMLISPSKSALKRANKNKKKIHWRDVRKMEQLKQQVNEKHQLKFGYSDPDDSENDNEINSIQKIYVNEPDKNDHHLKVNLDEGKFLLPSYNPELNDMKYRFKPKEYIEHQSNNLSIPSNGVFKTSEEQLRHFNQEFAKRHVDDIKEIPGDSDLLAPAKKDNDEINKYFQLQNQMHPKQLKSKHELSANSFKDTTATRNNPIPESYFKTVSHSKKTFDLQQPPTVHTTKVTRPLLNNNDKSHSFSEKPLTSLNIPNQQKNSGFKNYFVKDSKINQMLKLDKNKLSTSRGSLDSNVSHNSILNQFQNGLFKINQANNREEDDDSGGDDMESVIVKDPKKKNIRISPDDSHSPIKLIDRKPNPLVSTINDNDNNINGKKLNETSKSKGYTSSSKNNPRNTAFLERSSRSKDMEVTHVNHIISSSSSPSPMIKKSMLDSSAETTPKKVNASRSKDDIIEIEEIETSPLKLTNNNNDDGALKVRKSSFSMKDYARERPTRSNSQGNIQFVKLDGSGRRKITLDEVDNKKNKPTTNEKNSLSSSSSSSSPFSDETYLKLRDVPPKNQGGRYGRGRSSKDRIKGNQEEEVIIVKSNNVIPQNNNSLKRRRYDESQKSFNPIRNGPALNKSMKRRNHKPDETFELSENDNGNHGKRKKYNVHKRISGIDSDPDVVELPSPLFESI